MHLWAQRRCCSVWILLHSAPTAERWLPHFDQWVSRKPEPYDFRIAWAWSSANRCSTACQSGRISHLGMVFPR